MIPGDLVGLDPSIASPGATVFRDGLVYASAYFPIKTRGNHGEKCMNAALQIRSWLHNVGSQPTAIAYEWPQIYRGDEGKLAVMNAVIYMSGVDLALTALLAMDCAACNQTLAIFSWVPGDIWGNLPKRKTGSAFESPRGRRVKSRLSDAERAIVPDQHDAVDSCGIGLHASDRLGIHRAPYSATL